MTTGGFFSKPSSFAFRSSIGIFWIFAVEPEKMDGNISRICDYGSSFKSEKKTRLNRNCRKFHLTAFASNFE